MVNLLKVEGCTISAWDQEDDTISAIAEYSLTSWEEPESPDKVCSLSDYPLRKRVLVEKFAQQITINDPEIDYAELVYMQQTDLKVVLLAPMIFQDRALGLVELKDSRSERTFTDREISLIQMLANQAASALENARLYEHAQEEIAERKRAEEQIKNSLKEKEVLLKEIHHRVKNNLQVISSLLHLQSQSIENESTLEIFKESQNRVRSMALIHEKLYRSQDLAQIDFAQYIRNLTAYLIRSYKRDFSPVALKINAHGVLLGIDTAVPCGLIINELVSNALKHAFPANSDLSSGRKEGSENEICIGLSINEEQQVNLVVSDNGVGFPEEVDFQNTESLGMQLVNTLTTQLDGEVKLHINGGTEFRITFRVQ
jgi:two-component sensor histidine kinase